MTANEKIPWKRLSVEAAAIVGSILLAFAIDAWWQNRAERIVEVQYLEAMREDLVHSLKLLDDEEAWQRKQVGYLEALLNSIASTPYSDELRRWIDDGLFNVGTYQPQISSLQDLESSGQTQIIRNQDLRRLLAIVSQKMVSLRNVQADFQLSQQTVIDPFLVDKLDLSKILLSFPADETADLSILGTNEFRSRVAFKISLRREVSMQQLEIRAAFEEALELIEIEIDSIH
jgi:hypothetical protein